MKIEFRVVIESKYEDDALPHWNPSADDVQFVIEERFRDWGATVEKLEDVAELAAYLKRQKSAAKK